MSAMFNSTPVIFKLRSKRCSPATFAALALALLMIQRNQAMFTANDNQLSTEIENENEGENQENLDAPPSTTQPPEAQGSPAESVTSENSIEQDTSLTSNARYQLIDCGTMGSNHTHLIVKNPHHPEPTYVKAICETVIERSHPSVNKLTIKFKRLELYRPNYDGSCLQDRFAVYTDLNVAVSPVLCGNQTGKMVSVPFKAPQTSLIVSVTTSDLDHDRAWVLEIEQEDWPSQHSD